MNIADKIFEHIKFPVYYDDMGQKIFDQDGKQIVDVRGWGWIQKIDEDEKKSGALQDSLGEEIARMINDRGPNNRKNIEDSRCFDTLQDFVQEKIVPLDPPLVVGKLQTIDAAILWYFKQQEMEMFVLKGKQTKWIHIKELPKVGGEYLCVWDLDDGEPPVVAGFDYDAKTNIWTDPRGTAGSDMTGELLFWAELPDPPPYQKPVEIPFFCEVYGARCVVQCDKCGSIQRKKQNGID